VTKKAKNNAAAKNSAADLVVMDIGFSLKLGRILF
jgi:hypothetical protein